ncbi:MAG: AI-2E family transporter [Candidatus Nitrosoglobus sp.]|jgi:predicted PurR-regulated permease PerM
MSLISKKTDSSPLEVAGPINIRSVALALLAIFATLLMLRWAQAVLIPLVFSVLVSYSLDPIVSALERIRIPRWLGALLLITLLIGLMSYGSYSLTGQAEALLDKIPRAVQTLRRSFYDEPANHKKGVMEKVQEAAQSIQKILPSDKNARKKQESAKETSNNSVPTEPKAMKVEVVDSGLNLEDYVWWGSLGALAFLGQSVTVVVLVLVFLISGDTYKRKLVKISGHTLSQKKITVQIMDDINTQIRRHLFVLLLSGIFVGVLTWVAFLGIGLEQAALWGLIAGVASMIPYLGIAVIFAATSILALVQFGTLTMGLAVGVISLIITTIQDRWFTPWLTSRTTNLNAVVVPVGVLFWGWLWGPIGLIVATPILIIIKTCCDHIENLTSLGELMGSDSDSQ